MRDDKENLIVKLTFEFALEIIAFSEEIRKKIVLKWPRKFSGAEHQ